MNRTLTIFLLFAIPLFSMGQEKTKADSIKADTVKLWKKGGAITLNFNQTTLSNWAAGGDNSIATNGLVHLFMNYKKGKTSWDNIADLGYGLLRSGIRGRFYKSDDKIDVTTKWGHTAFYDVSYSALINFRSQFTKGYKTPDDTVIVSDFLSPGYLLPSIGMDYKPNDHLSLYLSPVTGKFTFVNNRDLADAGAFGVEPAEYDSSGNVIRHGDRVRKEFGAYLTFKFKKKLWDSITFSTKLDLFSNYFDRPGNIDVNWDALLHMKVNKYIAVSITTTLIYDHDVDIPIYETVNGSEEIVGYGPRTQFREVLAVGFSYKF